MKRKLLKNVEETASKICRLAVGGTENLTDERSFSLQPNSHRHVSVELHPSAAVSASNIALIAGALDPKVGWLGKGHDD